MSKRSAKQLNVNKIKIGNLVVDNKLRVGGILWLEDKYGKPLDEIDFSSGMVSDMVNFITAIAIGSNLDMPVSEIVCEIHKLDHAEILNYANMLIDALEVNPPKNPKTPARKVTGNLTE